MCAARFVAGWACNADGLPTLPPRKLVLGMLLLLLPPGRARAATSLPLSGEWTTLAEQVWWRVADEEMTGHASSEHWPP